MTNWLYIKANFIDLSDLVIFTQVSLRIEAFTFNAKLFADSIHSCLVNFSFSPHVYKQSCAGNEALKRE